MSTTIRRFLPCFAGAAALGLILAACGGSDDDKSDSTVSSAKEINVVITNSGCKPDVSDVQAGPLTFKISNKDATAVSEVELVAGSRILAEKENLAPGFSGSFSINLSAGTYDIFCPGAGTPHNAFAVSGTAAATSGDTDDLLKNGAKLYAAYVSSQVDSLVTTTQTLVEAINANDLAAAKTAYATSRIFYERIEPVAESFVDKKQDLDADIDAREGDVPDAQFRGFHKIEKGLWSAGSTAGLQSVAAELLTNVKRLQSLTKDLTYQPADLANGAVGLLEEVASGKITGEEERYSKLDIVDMQGNVEGAEQAFAYLQPGLEKIDSSLSNTVVSQFTALTALLDTYRNAGSLGGFVAYNTLSDADTRKLAQAVQAVSEPLSRVAAKVA